MVSVSHHALMGYLKAIPLRSKIIYLTLLGGVCLAAVSLPLVMVDISVRAPGVVRPGQERFEIKSVANAIIDSVYYYDGDTVPRDSPVVRLYDAHARARAAMLQHELRERKKLLHDLQWLTDNGTAELDVAHAWQSDALRQDWLLYLVQRDERRAVLEKARAELEVHRKLLHAQVISRKEYYDQQVENQQLEAAFLAFERNRLNDWHQQLTQCKSEYIQFELQWQQLVYDRYQYELRAPVSGVLMGMGDRYANSPVLAGEVIAVLSPAAYPVAEMYLAAKDIGLIRPGQMVRYQIEAYDYKYFGTVSGTVMHIDDDFTLQDGKPFFKVKANFHSTHLQLRNGYRVSLKKGMTFHAGLVISRRSLWQLLFDKMDDWLNPAAPAAVKD